MSSSRRDHLVGTALKLFCRQGFRATGIDSVLAESGVAKKTLYNHFKSKDELIIAALQLRDEQFLITMRASIARLATTQECDPSLARVLSYFDAMDEWIASDGFNGCSFINASAEYPRKEDPIHVACANHKKLLVHFIQELLSDMKLDDSLLVAKQVALIADGAIVNAHTGCDRQAAQYAKAAVHRLLETYLISQ